MTHCERASNAANVDAALGALVRLIRRRLAGEGLAPDVGDEMRWLDDGSALGRFLHTYGPPFAEYIAIALALAPHVRPGLLGAEIRAASAVEGDLPEIGGVRDDPSRTIVPTGETLAYLLAGHDLAARLDVHRLLDPESWLARGGIVRLEAAREGAPFLSGRLLMGRDWIVLFTVGTIPVPAFGLDFPARRLAPPLAGDDLALPDDVRASIAEIGAWMRRGEELGRSWGFGSWAKPGFRALFRGPVGTGKALAAARLGEAAGRDVYRVDLSLVVCEYIGETARRLEAVLDSAERGGWVLYFDETEALFGKRNEVADAHDRYANQEVSYLLAKLEEFAGLAIVACNCESELDRAFLRRLDVVVDFPMPGEAERRRIWRGALPEGPERAGLTERLARFELSGRDIVNVARRAALTAAARGDAVITPADAVRAIEAEMARAGRPFRNVLPDESGESGR